MKGWFLPVIQAAAVDGNSRKMKCFMASLSATLSKVFVVNDANWWRTHTAQIETCPLALSDEIMAFGKTLHVSFKDLLEAGGELSVWWHRSTDVSADSLSKTDTLCIPLIKTFPGRSACLQDIFQCWPGTAWIIKFKLGIRFPLTEELVWYTINESFIMRSEGSDLCPSVPLLTFGTQRQTSAISPGKFGN